MYTWRTFSLCAMCLAFSPLCHSEIISLACNQTRNAFGDSTTLDLSSSTHVVGVEIDTKSSMASVDGKYSRTVTTDSSSIRIALDDGTVYKINRISGQMTLTGPDILLAPVYHCARAQRAF